MRDRIVVRIGNAWLSQKLMQEDRLTLDKAVKEANSSELVKEHHEILKADENGKLEGKVNGVRNKKKSHPKSRNMKDNERLKELKPHQKFSRQNMLSLWQIALIQVRRMPSSQRVMPKMLKTRTLRYSVKRQSFSFIRRRRNNLLQKLKQLIQMIAISSGRSVARKTKRNGL